MFLLYIVFWFFIVLYLFSVRVFKKTKYGFFITMWEFGAWKTQNMTAYLKASNPLKEINITNYYTWYTDFQIWSHQDLINILNDIYDYHQYINLYDDRDKLFKFKPLSMLKEYEEKAMIFRNKYWDLKKSLKFNINIDEASIYFNPRNFAKNFSGANERLLDFVYQPRKLNLLMFCVVQSPMELDVKFRRLATYYRKYYKWFYFYRWYKDFLFINPEEIDLEKAEQVGWWMIFWMNINFYPIYPRYDYNTKELIRPWIDIYQKWSLIDLIKEITENQKIANTNKTNTLLKKLYVKSVKIFKK